MTFPDTSSGGQHRVPLSPSALRGSQHLDSLNRDQITSRDPGAQNASPFSSTERLLLLKSYYPQTPQETGKLGALIEAESLLVP